MKTVRLQNQLDEVFLVTPNDLGSSLLTRFYKRSTKPLKHFPFVVLVPVSFLLAAALYVLLGLSIVHVVSLLQNGF